METSVNLLLKFDLVNNESLTYNITLDNYGRDKEGTASYLFATIEELR